MSISNKITWPLHLINISNEIYFKINNVKQSLSSKSEYSQIVKNNILKATGNPFAETQASL